MPRGTLPNLLPASFDDERLASYPPADMLLASFREVAFASGAAESTAGSSIEGRPLVRFDFGTPGRPVVLLTALMHGVEMIGALALLDVLRRLTTDHDPRARRLMSEAHFVVLPIVNPDAFAANSSRLSRGSFAWQRCNSRGVDLNRNFPQLTTDRLYHPFSGSRFRLSPHYLGPKPLSEPESQSIASLAGATRPRLSLAFHSFGNMILYPWAYTSRANPRAAEYRALGSALTRSLVRFPYEVRQARQLYSVLGDMDDWLDAEVGSLAFTVEVSRPSVKLRNFRRLLNPFWWMNPSRVTDVVADLTPGVLALMASALGITDLPAEEDREEQVAAGPRSVAALAAK
jgi:murein tripeptide amidase MpaA